MMPLPSVDPVSIFLVLTAMAVLPFAAMVVTSYTKISVVLGLLRQAIGVQQTPPNTVLSGVALILSVYIMAPVLMQASDGLRLGGSTEATSNAQQLLRAADAAREPFRKFLDKHA